MGDASPRRHPYLKAPVLYLLNVPPRVKWGHIYQAFVRCGPIKKTGSFKTHGQHKTWELLFESLLQAEMALATMNDTQIVTVHKPHTIHLSAFQDPLDDEQHEPQVHTLMVPTSSTSGGRQRRFDEFRRFGPLASVQTEMEVGLPYRGDLLLFWDKESLLAAMNHTMELGGDGGGTLLHMSALAISQLTSSITLQDLVADAKKHGPVVYSCRLMDDATLEDFVAIFFENECDAAAARTAMHHSRMNGSVITASFYRAIVPERNHPNEGHNWDGHDSEDDAITPQGTRECNSARTFTKGGESAHIRGTRAHLGKESNSADTRSPNHGDWKSRPLPASNTYVPPPLRSCTSTNHEGDTWRKTSASTATTGVYKPPKGSSSQTVSDARDISWRTRPRRSVVTEDHAHPIFERPRFIVQKKMESSASTTGSTRIAQAEAKFNQAALGRRAAQVVVEESKRRQALIQANVDVTLAKVQESTAILEEARRIRYEAEIREAAATQASNDAIEAKAKLDAEAKDCVKALRDAVHAHLLAQVQTANVMREFADISFDHLDDTIQPRRGSELAYLTDPLDCSSKFAADLSAAAVTSPLPPDHGGDKDEQKRRETLRTPIIVMRDPTSSERMAFTTEQQRREDEARQRQKQEIEEIKKRWAKAFQEGWVNGRRGYGGKVLQPWARERWEREGDGRGGEKEIVSDDQKQMEPQDRTSLASHMGSASTHGQESSPSYVFGVDGFSGYIQETEKARRQAKFKHRTKRTVAREKAPRQKEERVQPEITAESSEVQDEGQQVGRPPEEQKDWPRTGRDQQTPERESMEHDGDLQDRVAIELKLFQELQKQKRRVKKWRKGHLRETQRCRTRDQLSCQDNTVWSPSLALQRYRDVGKEFDDTAFTVYQPLVFESVPWPLLHRPDSLDLSMIDRGAVDDFFRHVQTQLKPWEYKDLVESAYHRFHPDRWSSRGIVPTILDKEMRSKVRDAGNIVSQAIVPIWNNFAKFS